MVLTETFSGVKLYEEGINSQLDIGKINLLENHNF